MTKYNHMYPISSSKMQRKKTANDDVSSFGKVKEDEVRLG